MDKAKALFLESLRCAVREEDLSINEKPEQTVLRRLFRLAREQSLVALTAQAISSCERLRDDPHVSAFLREARPITLHQATRTGDFLLLLDQLDALGLHPTVLKGIVCRSLYPEPEQRPSADEDLLIPPQDFTRYHEALLSCGLRRLDPEDSAEDYEITYVDKDRYLYLEVHLRLFSPVQPAFERCSRYFEDCFDRSMSVSVYGRQVCTMEATDHLLYMLCHAYKHLLYSGVGVRQICDICLFAERFSAEIDWQRLHQACIDCGLAALSSAIFLVGERHLAIPCPAVFRDETVDELPLLNDCLDGGVFGAEDENRLHSSNLTLGAVSSEKRARTRMGIWKSLFPGKDYLQNRYPYARKHPWLLPAAWAQRVLNYVFGSSKVSPVKSLKIGQDRVELLRHYKIIS